MHAELSTLIIALVLAMLLSAVSMICYFIQRRRDERRLILEPESKKIPLEPMFDAYCRITRDLQLCATKKQVSDQYLEVLLFSCYYKDSDSFTSELIDLYNSVEAEYSNPT